MLEANRLVAQNTKVDVSTSKLQHDMGKSVLIKQHCKEQWAWQAEKKDLTQSRTAQMFCLPETLDSGQAILAQCMAENAHSGVAKCVKPNFAWHGSVINF